MSPVAFVPLSASMMFFGAFAAGAWLLLTARTRRTDDRTPHCFMCGYNLTGLTSGVCPECGIELTEDMRSSGPPSELRWWRLLLGGLLVGGVLMFVLVGYYTGRYR